MNCLSAILIPRFQFLCQGDGSFRPIFRSFPLQRGILGNYTRNGPVFQADAKKRLCQVNVGKSLAKSFFGRITFGDVCQGTLSLPYGT
ncbi:MAG: hypothetical protein J6H18_00470, partial [Lachnospiraceae bacterium]|nr:hypothetical protein [Lachnospiraceae bacterium]